jgi:hypothetical protein
VDEFSHLENKNESLRESWDKKIKFEQLENNILSSRRAPFDDLKKSKIFDKIQYRTQKGSRDFSNQNG